VPKSRWPSRESRAAGSNPTDEPAAVERPAPTHGLWHNSSMDLAQGLDVVEVPLDTLPGELWPPQR
jgi:hypothetical protein